MKPVNSLIEQIIETADTLGMTQKVLAARAGVPEETLSRGKKRGSMRLDSVERLARAAGVEIGLVRPATASALRRTTAARLPFREKYGVALAWSNADASDELLVRRALVQPRFQVLLDAAVAFGVDVLAAQWDRLQAEGSPEAVKVRPTTERILGHIRDGYRQVTA